MTDAFAVVTMLASVVVVVGGLWTAIRSGLRVRDSMRENTAATQENTRTLAELIRVGGRLDSIESRVDRLESRARA